MHTDESTSQQRSVVPSVLSTTKILENSCEHNTHQRI